MARALAEAYSIEKAKQILRANNNPQPSYFRVNVNRMSVDDFMAASEYNHRGFEKTESPPACVMFQHGRGGFPAREHESGWLTPQDRSTQFIPYYLMLEKGDRVLDLCCGSGIKTAQMIEIAPEDVEVTAVDRFSHKLASLENELSRLGLSRIATVEADITDKPCLGEFNKILLDAPCSNSGTVRRRPEIKYRMREADISELTATQDSLLDAASGYMTSGGSLVYSTCSILPIENDRRIEGFLYRHPEFELATGEIESSLRFVSPRARLDKYGVTFFPNSTNACGTYVCVVRKKR
jgi:16S rRNA (cytosine967-C5)-methyltransferase